MLKPCGNFKNIPRPFKKPRCTKKQWANRKIALKSCWAKGSGKPAWKKRDLQRACFIKFNKTNPLKKCRRARIPKRIRKPTKLPPRKTCKNGWVANFNSQVGKCAAKRGQSNKNTFKSYRVCRRNAFNRYRFLKRRGCVVTIDLKKPKRRTPKKPTCKLNKWIKRRNTCRNKPASILSKTKWRPKFRAYWAWNVRAKCYRNLNRSSLARICKKTINIGKAPKKPVNTPKKTCKVGLWNKKIASCRTLWRRKMKNIRVRNVAIFKWRVTNSCFDRLSNLKKRNFNFARCTVPRKLQKPKGVKKCKKGQWRSAIKNCRHFMTRRMMPAGTDLKVWKW